MTNIPRYYVPAQSYWPITGAIGLALLALGAIQLLHQHATGYWLFSAGALIIAYMMYGWFSDVILESQQGLYSEQLNRSFRWGMGWFIFSEAMFFACFFGALYYTRLVGLERLSEAALLWPDFSAQWPLLRNPDNASITAPAHAMGAWGLPSINTAILLTSGLTLTLAHWGLKVQHRRTLVLYTLLTSALGFIFLYLQAVEYQHAYHSLGLTMDSGIYGSTFFMLTGFHGAHVCIGSIMLLVMAYRAAKGHFTPTGHFAFEATAWYWHFVDVVWLLLFILVYWL